jgi:hypothetical protein
MEADRPGSKPDETDSSVPGALPQDSDQSRAETAGTTAEKATPSRLPAETKGVPSEAEKAEEEYILEREPDGRYRIVGRRPRKQQ